MTDGSLGLEFVLLDPDRHDRASFTSGEASLDRYVLRQATQDIRRGLCVAYVYAEVATGRILGYYTLSAWSIQPEGLPFSVTRRLPRYDAYPASLIGRLAVDEDFQGRRVGSKLVADALRRSSEPAESLGILAVVVDALDERAAAYYRRFGFAPFEDDELRLFMTIAEVNRIVRPAR